MISSSSLNASGTRIRRADWYGTRPCKNWEQFKYACGSFAGPNKLTAWAAHSDGVHDFTRAWFSTVGENGDEKGTFDMKSHRPLSEKRRNDLIAGKEQSIIRLKATDPVTEKTFVKRVDQIYTWRQLTCPDPADHDRPLQQGDLSRSFSAKAKISVLPCPQG